MAHTLLARAAALVLLLMLPFAALAQEPESLPQLPPHAAPTHAVQTGSLPLLNTTPNFDAQTATNAYLARVSGAARAKSDAYFEGGYWLILADFLWGLAVAGILLGLGVSARVRDTIEDFTHYHYAQWLIYAGFYVVVTAVLTFPLTLYEGFFREHSYGLSNQDFWQWLGDFGINFGVSLVAAFVVIPILYWAIRLAGRAWWIWGAGIVIVFMMIAMAIYPVFIAPLTNHYSPLADSPIKHEILSLARANDIPADNVWYFDASRQSNRISANVSGFLGTTRISLNDNLMKQAGHDEVLAVLGHEMGHYVMNHVLVGILLEGLLFIFGFWFMDFGFRALTGIFGGNWQVREVSDIAGLPLLAALMSIWFFVLTPISNTITRTMEHQADIFGVDAVRKPDAFATVALKLSTYRKLDPGPWEEFIFYDHPSGRTRIHSMMVWKKEHIGDLDIRDTVAGNPH